MCADLPELREVSVPGLALFLGWLIRSGSRSARHGKDARPRATIYWAT